jgi:hypothetical protein
MRINHSGFYCKNKDTYPPFKTGLYLEEFFLDYYERTFPILTKTYIPALWTNFQIESWFPAQKQSMQLELNQWIQDNPSENGYFTVIQHDDGPFLTLPENTIIYGACSGNIPIPLIYEDLNQTLESIPKKSFSQKTCLCSFIGNITANSVLPNVRQIMFDTYQNNPNFKMICSGGWTAAVIQQNQHLFIETTVNSKFAFAPRGYGRSSFRFFEVFQLGTIPIYIWNDVNWLPFQNIIDYRKLCICIHISDIHMIEQTLLCITEEQYENMMNYYHEIKYLFELEGMSEQIIKENTLFDLK